MTFLSAFTLGNVPLRIALSVGVSNHHSTRFTQDEPVGVQCRWNRGLCDSHRQVIAFPLFDPLRAARLKRSFASLTRASSPS